MGIKRVSSILYLRGVENLFIPLLLMIKIVGEKHFTINVEQQLKAFFL